MTLSFLHKLFTLRMPTIGGVQSTLGLKTPSPMLGGVQVCNTHYLEYIFTSSMSL